MVHLPQVVGEAENVSLPHIYASATVREFDERVIVPLFGYSDVWEYYR
jgi:predicted alpha/beta-fold hydrolase